MNRTSNTTAIRQSAAAAVLAAGCLGLFGLMGAAQAAGMDMGSGHDHHQMMMQGEHAGHAMHEMHAVRASGVVKAIDAASGKITIEHEPIAELNYCCHYC